MLKPAVLVYSKDYPHSALLCKLLAEVGCHARAAFYAGEAELAVKAKRPDKVIAFIDMFPLPEPLAGIPLIVATPESGMAKAKIILHRHGIGAASCLVYPFSLPQLQAVLKTDAGGVAEQQQTGLLGNSSAICSLKEMIKMAAAVDSPALILGETGSGKELVAAALHSMGQRSGAPFVAVNCGGMPESLLDSELFGHERGAFTGAHKKRVGKLQMADGGTLFLDELGDMPMPLQIKLLRVLEDGSFYPVGSSSEVRVNIRIISATNKDIFQMVADGSFRRDLLYRINVLAIKVPPLRKRGADIELLANHFLQKFQKSCGKKQLRFSTEVAEQMAIYSWHGNVRELMHCVEQAVVRCKGSVIKQVQFAGAALAEQISSTAPPVEQLLMLDMKSMQSTVLESYEKAYLDKILTVEFGSIDKVAKRCGIDRKTLYRKMKQYELSKRDYK